MSGRARRRPEWWTEEVRAIQRVSGGWGLDAASVSLQQALQAEMASWGKKAQGRRKDRIREESFSPRR